MLVPDRKSRQVSEKPVKLTHDEGTNLKRGLEPCTLSVSIQGQLAPARWSQSSKWGRLYMQLRLSLFCS